MYAFEPHAANFDSLLPPVRLNGLRNVTCMQSAVSDLPGLIGFNSGPNPLIGHITRKPTGHLVPETTIDGFLDRFPEARRHPLFLEAE